jgi:hypothetical protein
MHAMKGPYSSERSVALMIARELLKEIVKRDTQQPAPVISRHDGSWFFFSRRSKPAFLLKILPLFC